MNTTRDTHVPRAPEDVARFIEDFRDAQGFAPLAGGEGPGVVGLAAGSPGPEGVAGPGISTAEPPAAAPAAAPPAGAPEAVPVEAPPAWATTLIERFDQMAPAAVDPLAVELGLVDPPPPAPGQPPLQQQPAPASPGQPQAQPQPGTPFPGAPMTPEQQQAQQVAEVQQWVNQQIQEGVQRGIQEYVEPRFQLQQRQTRQEEIAGLRSDYPAFNDPQQASAIVARGRQWAQMMGLPETTVGEPAFLEMVYLTGLQIDANRVAQAQQQPGGVPTLPAGQPGVPIEQPGAAAPAPPLNAQQEIASNIVKAGAGNGLAGSAFA